MPDALWDALLIDGVELPDGLPADVAAGVCVDGPWAWPFQQGVGRGEFPEYQGFDGAGYTDQPYATSVLPVYVTISAPQECDEDGVPVEQSDETWAWLNNAMETVRRACKPDRPITLTRRRSMPSDVVPGDMNTAHTARAKLANITSSRPGRDTLRLVIEFTLLDGVWFGEEIEDVLPDHTTFNYEVLGDVRTPRIQVDLPASSSLAGVQNSTNGYGFTYNAVTPASTVTVDIEDRTAILVSTGQNLARYLIWRKVHPLRLDPGDNTLTTQNTVTLRYQPAYL